MTIPQLAPAPCETVGTDAYRAAMRRVPAAVAIVTAVVDGVRHGFTATAIASVSATPPQVLVCVDTTTRSANAIRAAGRFGLNYLRQEQADLAKVFAAPTADPEHRFRRARWRQTSGAPMLLDAVVGFDCRVVEQLECGTHVVLIGQVADLHDESGNALVYEGGGFGRFCSGPAMS